MFVHGQVYRSSIERYRHGGLSLKRSGRCPRKKAPTILTTTGKARREGWQTFRTVVEIVNADATRESLVSRYERSRGKAFRRGFRGLPAIFSSAFECHRCRRSLTSATRQAEFSAGLRRSPTRVRDRWYAIRSPRMAALNIRDYVTKAQVITERRIAIIQPSFAYTRLMVQSARPLRGKFFGSYLVRYSYECADLYTRGWYRSARSLDRGLVD